MNPTQAGREELDKLLESEFHLFRDADLEFEEAYYYLCQKLECMKPEGEYARLTELYWGLEPLLLVSRVLNKPVSADLLGKARSLLLDPLSVNYQHEVPHIISIYGCSLLRHHFGIALDEKERKQLQSHVESLYDDTQGGYRATLYGECDARTTYAALTILHVNSLECPHAQRISEFYMQKLGFGFSGTDNAEPHASFTYCSLAALELLKLRGVDAELSRTQELRLRKFLIFRQQPSGGFNGRINKLEDGCYNFWVGASLVLLDCEELIDLSRFNDWFRVCNQDFDQGGFRDKPGVSSDRFHCCYALTGWWLLNGREGVKPYLPVLCDE